MTTIPTPSYLALLCLAPFGLLALFVVLAVAIFIACFEIEEMQRRKREKRENAQLYRSIDEYLQKVGEN